MMLHRFAVLTLCLTVLMPTLSLAQFGFSTPTEGLSATATEKVLLKPEKLRLIMLVKAQGGDAKAAVVALTEHKERVQKELVSMKAQQDSIAFSATRVITGDGDPNSEGRMMQIQMMRSTPGGGVSSTPQAMPSFYTASCALKAEWSLPVNEGDALAILPATLRAQISARDLAGEKNQPKLSKADQEKLEELQTMMQESYSYSSGDEGKGVRILFVAQISDDVKQKATQAAFQKAAKEAQSLSASAGIPLGKLVGLYSMMPNTVAERYYASAYNNTNAEQLTQFQPGEGTVGAENADELSLDVSVTLTYSVQ